MADDLPADFDVVILGTGLPESIIAAACSRIGQRVLHLDTRNYYGGNWASFTFSGLQTWIEDNKRECGVEERVASTEHTAENEEQIPLNQNDTTIQNIEIFTYSRNGDSGDVEEAGALGMNLERLTTDSTLPDATNEDAPQVTPSADQPDAPAEIQDTQDAENAASSDQKESAGSDQIPSDSIVPAANAEPSPAATCHKAVTYSDIVREGRRFNIDLVSKVGASGILLHGAYTRMLYTLPLLCYPYSHTVPHTSLSVVVMQRFIFTDYKDRTFSEFLQSKRLTPSLQHFVLCSIAMVSETANTLDGLRATQKFLQCLGRYGNTPFLFHMYGLGEIPQCFCRMSAVFGGLYCLHHSLRCLLVEEESGQCKAVIDSRGKRISCSHVIMENAYLPERTCAQVCYSQISRAILITDRSILKSESHQEISVLTVPPEEGQQTAVYLTELCSATSTCMKNTYLVHLTCPSMKATAREDLEPVVQKLFTRDAEEEPQSDQSEKPQALWILYFNMRDSSGVERQSYVGLPSNVHVCSGPDSCFGYDHAVQQAENIFREMFPTEEFCPPAPNPEDIIYDQESQEPDPGEPDTTVDSKADPSPDTDHVAEPAGGTEEPQTE
ncbi:rab proteins geranylgeranyltransferase component A 1 [Pseudophryne corroboree]|uniref:rab proteins geranylgeranyltransferase component A 1 n=1 Tax=Pseudophryne corroboree TaxID=495146 RepID=UPI003081524C